MVRNKKRGYEAGSEKVSPPSKMSKGINATKADEILSKLISMETRFAAIEKDLTEVRQLLEEIQQLKKEVQVLKETCNGFQKMEIEAKKRSVLIRGLRFKSSGKYESRLQTKSALGEFFDKMEFLPHLMDYQRLGGRREGEDGAKIAVRIEFADVDMKFKLFDKLKEWSKDIREITVLTDYPSFQLPEFKRLSEQGFKIRKEAPGTKTRVVPRGNELILQKRTNAEERWTSVTV